MLRRLYHEQPESFAFTPANRAWAEAQITKYPEGRQASAVIALLWRAQEQEGWLSRPAIEHVAAMLDMAYIRALEVATFYFMFHLHPVGSVAHFQICGTTPCMLCGSEALMAVCRDKIAAEPFQLSEDGKFSWEEVECLGACSNAPMAQVGKDYYEDLTPEGFAGLIDALAAGEVPRRGASTGPITRRHRRRWRSTTSRWRFPRRVPGPVPPAPGRSRRQRPPGPREPRPRRPGPRPARARAPRRSTARATARRTISSGSRASGQSLKSCATRWASTISTRSPTGPRPRSPGSTRISWASRAA